MIDETKTQEFQGSDSSRCYDVLNRAERWGHFMRRTYSLANDMVELYSVMYTTLQAGSEISPENEYVLTQMVDKVEGEFRRSFGGKDGSTAETLDVLADQFGFVIGYCAAHDDAVFNEISEMFQSLSSRLRTKADRIRVSASS